MTIAPVAVFHSPFSSKFGIPKQSGVVEMLKGEIVFLQAYRNPDALRGLETFDYLWLIWDFNANKHHAGSLMVRPPRLGGNKKVGVFASRSPFRPNGLGLSSVKIEMIEWESNRGPVIHVLGADLMNGTPIYDIKPYVTYTDAHVNARSGFVDTNQWQRLQVVMSDEVHAFLLSRGFDEERIAALKQVLEQDPRPPYQDNPDKIYGMPFMGADIHFCVKGDVLTVLAL